MQSRTAAARKALTLVYLLATVLVALGLSEKGESQVFNDVFLFSVSGQNPVDVTPAQGRDGRLYGITNTGGLNFYGTVFRINTDGVGGTIYDFDLTNGGEPCAGLTLGTDGNFYGTVGVVGNILNLTGGLYRVSPAGRETLLHTFAGGSDGSSPCAPPIEGSDGNLYGTTGGDFATPHSTLYRYSRDGTFTTLFQFEENSFTQPAPMQAADGNLYVTSASGGACNGGHIYKLTTAGFLLHTYDFPCGMDGAVPYSPLLQASDGNFYGTTAYGGSATWPGYGTIFKMNQHGAVTTLYRFTASGPRYPWAGLVQATDGNLYGATLGIGDNTLYQITPSGVYADLYTFTNATGQSPLTALMQHTNGILYGVTAGGGYGEGTIYSLDMGLGPLVTFVRPTGKVGQSAQILGQGLTGSKSVTFNGVPATSFSVVSNTYMTAVVPSDASTGAVVVTTPSGPLTSNVSFRISQ
jgi:uncharacterized repeat protein (TIGR03803 family)